METQDPGLRAVCFQECVGPAASSLESSIKWGDGFLIMYSVTDRSSFEAVSRLKRLIDHIKQTLGKTIHIVDVNDHKLRRNSDTILPLALLRAVLFMYMVPPTSE